MCRRPDFRPVREFVVSEAQKSGLDLGDRFAATFSSTRDDNGWENPFFRGKNCSHDAKFLACWLSKTSRAEVAELVDAHDSKSCGAIREGSIPSFGTRFSAENY